MSTENISVSIDPSPLVGIIKKVLKEEMQPTLYDSGNSLAQVIVEEITQNASVHDHIRDIVENNIDYTRLADEVKYSRLAANLNSYEVANEFSAADLAAEVSLSGIADELSVTDIANEIDVASVASEIEMSEIVEALDYKKLAEALLAAIAAQRTTT